MSKFLAVLLLVAASPSTLAERVETPYDSFVVKSVGDFLRLCRPLSNLESMAPEDTVEAVACLSYTAGVVNGYASTLALRAEYEIADELGSTRAKVAEQLGSDSALHDKVAEHARTSHFLCFDESYGLADIAVHVVRQLEEGNVAKGQSAHYVIMNEMQSLLSCPER